MGDEAKQHAGVDEPTAGPWYLQDGKYVCGEGGAQIATLYSPDKGVGENAANGALLAAAPAMLAALEASEHTFSNLAEAEDLTDADSECWHMIRAAIVKAKGE